MGILAKVETSFGEERDVYIRVNSVEVNNHNVSSTALMRGFLSREAFEGGKNYVYEKTVRFNADVSSSMWEQAYKAFCEQEGFENVEV